MEKTACVADLIMKYKTLLDNGAITEAEYQAKKAQLLNAEEFHTQSASASSSGESILSVKATSVWAYLSWFGFFLALIAGERKKAVFHLNQAMVINLFTFGTIIPIIGWIWGVFMLVCWIMGLVYACKQEEKPVPLIGKIKIFS